MNPDIYLTTGFQISESDGFKFKLMVQNDRFIVNMQDLVLSISVFFIYAS